jgi:CubicO group peptidase (beta-lactamase class C family)
VNQPATDAVIDPATDPRQALLEQIREKAGLPGLVAGTSRDGAVDWSCALGEAGSAYRVASITKTFTAVAVMQLRDQGRLALDDPLGRHLPGAPYADATVRRLLTHASGMTAEPTGPWWERVPGGTWDDLVAANPEHYVFPPGRRHHYSNLGFALLGKLVEELRGAAWWDVVTDLILAPVGMTSTTFSRPSGAAIGTSRNPLTGDLVREPSEDEGAMAPAGQLWSTIDDLCRWADVLVAGHPGVLSADTAAEMRTIQAADPETQHRGGYGLGLRLHWDEQGTVVGHTGSLPGFVAGMFCDARSRVGAVVLTNATYGLDPEGTCAQLIAAASHGDPPIGPVADPSSPAADLAGPWYWGNVPFELVATAHGLSLVSGSNESRLLADGADSYRGVNGYWAGEQLGVHRDPDGTPRHLDIVTFVLTRTPYDPKAPIPGGPPERFGD